LYVTVRSDQWTAEEALATFEKCHVSEQGAGSTHVIVMENKGMDGGGWLQVMLYMKRRQRENNNNTDNSLYKYVLKLHTKRSYTGKQFTDWRALLSDACVGDSKQVIYCLNLLKTNPTTIGMIGTTTWLIPDRLCPELKNYCLKWDVLNTTKQTLSNRAGLHFVAGTMFWARFDLVATYPFLNRREEQLLAMFQDMLPGYVSGLPVPTDAHIMERLFGLFVEEQNMLVHGLNFLGGPSFRNAEGPRFLSL
jgi:hypothetical protein